MLGDKLRELRGDQSQKAVADSIGISRARLSHYETSRSEPPLEILKQLAEYYKVPVDDLLNEPVLLRPTIKYLRDPYDGDKRLQEVRIVKESAEERFSEERYLAEKRAKEEDAEHTKMMNYFNNPQLNLFHKELLESPEEDLERLQEMWEIMKKHKGNK